MSNGSAKWSSRGASRSFPYEQIVTDFLNEPEWLSEPLKKYASGELSTERLG
jgi:hypothetical protein